MVKADIIIRAKNGHDMTQACMESIYENTREDSYRLILVDDGSDSYTPGLPDVLVRCRRSSGAVTATNLGLAVALQGPAPYVIVMDNDTEVPRGDFGWLDRFVAEIESAGPQCAAVGATSNFVSGAQHVLACPQTYTGDWNDDKGKGGTARNLFVPVFVSFCVLLRKDAVRRVGLWDNQYDPGNWEDTDYALQLRTAGYSIAVARSVYIHHKGHATFRDDLQQLMKTNREKFAAKWGLGRLWDLGLVPHNEMIHIVDAVGGRAR